MLKINKNEPHCWHFKVMGDHSLFFYLDERMDENINIEVHHFCAFIRTKNINAFKDIIPSYHAVTIVYAIDQLYTYLHTSKKYLSLSHLAESFIEEYEIFKQQHTSFQYEPNNIEIPVCYHSSFGIDLIKIAAEKNKDVEEIIQIHCSKMYRVFCLGFMPGFAYMGEVDNSIQSPRHPKPRPFVHAGSVGIAGSQTGIYPSDSPGGWQIIGRTPLTVFDPIKLALLNPGDLVNFYAITKEEFDAIKNNRS
jgi:inhibitor of KinA